MVSVSLVLLAQCNKSNTGEAEKESVMSAVIISLDERSAPIEAASAIPIESLQLAANEIAGMISIAKSGESISKLEVEWLKSRCETIKLLSKLSSSNLIDRDNRSKILSFVHQSKDDVADLGSFASKDSAMISECMNRHSVLLKSAKKSNQRNPELDYESQVVLNWLLTEVEKEVLGRYYSFKKNRSIKNTGVSVRGCVKGKKVGPREMTFDLDPTSEYIIIAYDSNENSYFEYVDVGESIIEVMSASIPSKVRMKVKMFFQGVVADRAVVSVSKTEELINSFSQKESEIKAITLNWNQQTTSLKKMASFMEALSKKKKQIERVKSNIISIKKEQKSKQVEIKQLQSSIADFKISID